LKEVPLWSDNFPDLKDVSLENENLELLSWHKVNEHGKANQIILEEMVLFNHSLSYSTHQKPEFFEFILDEGNSKLL